MANETTPILQVEDMVKQFEIKRTLLDVITHRPAKYVRAVDGVSFTVARGETLGLVGESGCGKSTLAKTLSRLGIPDRGKVLFEGKDFFAMEAKQLKQARYKMQMVFQDPYASLNPRMTIRQMLYEVLSVHKLCPRWDREAQCLQILRMVGMDTSVMDRYPGQFSGGQRQRISIARALVMRPELLIADEPVSALDVSIQAQVINLLLELKHSLGLTMLFISHDLRVVRYLSDRVMVMYLGTIVEIGEAERLFTHPHHPYTDILIKAAPQLKPTQHSHESAIQGEMPSPVNVPTGCRFHPRCPYVKALCSMEKPALQQGIDGQMVACHFPINM